MFNPAPILVYGQDPGLLETRRMVLETIGGEVFASSDLEGAKQTIFRKRPGLLVLCYTLSPENRKSIMIAASALNPAMKILVLQADGPAGAETAHDTLNIFAGPAVLKAKVLELLAQAPARQAQTG